MLETDEQLMVRLSSGDKDAFEALFLRYKNRLYAFIYRFFGDPAVTEEIFQETFLRVYKYSPKYKPVAKFSTFLYRIATNLSINELKRRKLVPMYYLGTLKDRQEGQQTMIEEDVQSQLRSPEDRVYADELEFHLQKALNSLPESMRVTLLLSEVEGKKYDEIAVIMNCSVGTVKSRVNRSRSKLLQYFSDHEIL